LAGAVIAEPGWAVIAVMAVPPFVLKVMVTFAIDEDEVGVALLELELLDELELELDVTDDVEELEEGVEEDELEVTDDVEELEDGVVVELEDVSTGVEDVGTEFDVGVRLTLGEEFDNVIKPRVPIAVTITDPPINQNQKGFLRFLSVSSTTSMTFSMMVLSSFMVNISFKDC
jgi:hypothetical protein